ncbi:MAG: PAS domain S-box-containing protein [Hyphomicrobiaceae bacterium]|jgi:PAS domain S-box-containing protein
MKNSKVQRTDAFEKTGGDDRLIAAMVAATSEPLAVLDESGAVVAANDSGREMVRSRSDDQLSWKQELERAGATGVPIVRSRGPLSPLRAQPLDGTQPTRWIITINQPSANAIQRSRLEHALKKLPVMACITDAQGEVLFQNDASVEFCGARVIDWRTAIPRQTHKKLARAESEISKTQSAFEAKIEVFRHDGEERWLQMQGSPLFEDGDSFQGFLVLSFDITDRYKASRKNRRRREQFKVALHDAQVGVAVIEPDGLISHANPPACDMLRTTREKLLYTRVGTLTEEATRDEDKLLFLAFGRGEIRSSQNLRTFIRSDGTRFRGERNLVAVHDEAGELDFLVAMVTDVSEREEAIDRAHRAEAEMRLLTDSLPVVIAHVDANLRFRLANKVYEQWLGIPAEKLIGIRMNEFFGETLFARVRPFVETVMGGAPVKFEWSTPLPDGTERHMLSQYVPNIDDEGTQNGFFVLVFDESERIESEAKIHQLNEELEERVRQRTARLQDVNEELEAFCYSVSHDLRGPLRSMEGFSALLLESYEDRIGEEGSDWLQRIAAASRRGGRLIDELLNLSRVTRADVSRASVDLSEIANRVADELTTNAKTENSDQCAIFEIEPGLTTSADPTLAAGVVENLIGNAWKFTANRADASIRVGRQGKGTNAEFFVADNGVGFDMRYADKLFSPFHRLHQQDEFEGDGIGLATVKRIIGRHGGSIRAQSSLGNGATFFFRFCGGGTDEQE